MPSQVEHVGPCEKVVEVTVQESVLKSALDGKYRELRQQINLPGFRAGKVPRSLLERRYGDHVRGEVLEEILNDGVKEAIEEQKLVPLSSPELEPPTEGEKFEFPESGDFVFSFKVDTRPEFELPKHRGLAVERKIRQVGEDQVDEVITQLAERNAQFEPVEDDEAVYAPEYLVQALVSAKAGDSTLADEEVLYWHADSPNLNERIELVDGAQQLEGKKIGDTIKAEGVVPETDKDADLAGSEIDITFEIQEFKQRAIPAVDDEFATLLGKTDLADLRDSIRKDMESKMQRVADQQATDDLLEAVLNSVEIALPDSYVEKLVSDAIHRRAQELEKEDDAVEGHDEAHKVAEKDRPQIRERVEKEVRLELVLDAIGEKRKIFCLEEDVQREFQTIAEENGTTAASVREFYENYRLMPDLRGKVRERKIREYLLEEASVTDVNVGDEEAPASGDSAASAG